MVAYLSVFLRCKIFDELLRKIVTRKPRESYAVINLISWAYNFVNIPSNAAVVSRSIRALLHRFKTYVCLSAETKKVKRIVQLANFLLWPRCCNVRQISINIELYAR